MMWNLWWEGIYVSRYSKITSWICTVSYLILAATKILPCLISPFGCDKELTLFDKRRYGARKYSTLYESLKEVYNAVFDVRRTRKRKKNSDAVEEEDGND
jgi:hypothetical protein